MIRIDVNEQELFEMIMALHAFQKADAAHGVPGESRKYEELAECRSKLLEKLHAAFEAQAMPGKTPANVFKMNPRS